MLALDASLLGLIDIPGNYRSMTEQEREAIDEEARKLLEARAAKGDKRAAAALARHKKPPRHAEAAKPAPQAPAPSPSRAKTPKAPRQPWLQRLWKRAPAALTRRPSVALLTPGLNLGGAERVTVDLARCLPRDKLDVIGVGVRAPALDPGLLAKACARVPVGVGPHACQQLAERADITIWWGSPEPPLANQPTRPRGRGRPLAVFCSHGGNMTREAIAAFAAEPHVRLTAVSKWAANNFPPDAEYAVIHNGAAQDRLRQLRPRGMTRGQWGATMADILIGYVGRISSEKNVAAPAIAAQELGEPYRPVYIGPGAQDAEALVREICPRAIFVPPNEEVGDYWSALDCFVLASRSEGFSLSMIEAWLCGVPVVATPVGAVPEVEAACGPMTVRVNSPPSPTELRDAVRRALSDENKPTVQHAKQVAEREFTAPAMAARWTKYLLAIA